MANLNEYRARERTDKRIPARRCAFCRNASHLHFAFEAQSPLLYLRVLSVLKFDVSRIKAKPQAGKSPALSDKI